MPLYTIGHSTRELGEFLQLLQHHGIDRVVDVRRYPGSRRHPHFGSDNLRISLAEAGTAYRHAADLGGRRRAAGDSVHLFWRSDSFRAYADYMDTPAFRAALATLLDEAATEPTAIMCAEALPWRCHRNLISDAVVALGLRVEHILDPGPPHPHVLNPGARVRADGSVIYPPEQADQGTLDL